MNRGGEVPAGAFPLFVFSLIQFNAAESIFDRECSTCPAQYASSKETPSQKWEKVVRKLSQLNTSRLHYVKVPENHIVIDFDIPDDQGGKCFERNLEEASKWPPTYAEVSKSGCGIHLHYIYTGDPAKLSRIYDDHIEVKVFTGKSSLRRKLTKCNNLPIATISSGLPLKGESNVVNTKVVQSEKGIRTGIMRNLNKEIHPNTKSISVTCEAGLSSPRAPLSLVFVERRKSQCLRKLLSSRISTGTPVKRTSTST